MPRSALLRLLALGAIWGTSFYLIRIGLRGVSPSQVALGRTLGGAAALWLITLIRRVPVVRDPGTWTHAAVICVFGNVVPFFLFAWGEERVTSGLAGVFNALTPLATVLIALAMLPEERATTERVFGIGLGIAGVAVLARPWADSGHNALAGQLACIGAAVSYGLAFNWTRRFVTPRRVDPVALSTAQLTCATAIMLVLAPFVARQPVDARTDAFVAIAALGVFGTGIAFVIYHSLIRDIGAMDTSLVTFIIPVVAVLLGIVALDEPAHVSLLAGGAIVVLGVAVAQGRFGRAATHAEPPTADAPCD